jgi:hypothetical protein
VSSCLAMCVWHTLVLSHGSVGWHQYLFLLFFSGRFLLHGLTWLVDTPLAANQCLSYFLLGLWMSWESGTGLSGVELLLVFGLFGTRLGWAMGCFARSPRWG